MKKISIIIIFFTIFVLLNYSFNFAQIIPTDVNEPISIDANEMQYDIKQNLYIAKGNVEIKQGMRTIKADEMKLYNKTKEVIAIGNVILYEGKDFLACDQIKFNLETTLGDIKAGELYFSKENIRMTGDTISRTKEDIYILKNSIFTPCKGKRPAWRITSKEIEVEKENVARAKDATFQIKNVPVLYFPYILFPIKTKRQTGLLFPRIGSSSREGFKLENSFFWAINPSLDATYYLDIATKKGVGQGIETRYAHGDKNHGEFYTYFISERSSYQDDYSELLDREKDRWSVQFVGEHYITPDFFAKAKLKAVSDRQFHKDYSDNLTKRTQEKEDSISFITKIFGDYNLTGGINYHKDLLKSSSYIPQKLPFIYFRRLNKNIYPTPLFFDFDSSFSHFNRDEGSEGYRIDIKPQILLPIPMDFNNYFKNTLKIGFHEKIYFDLENSGSDKSESQGRLVISDKISTSLFNIYNFDYFNIKKIKHIIKPEIEYNYIPSKSQSSLPLFDEVDKVSNFNYLTFTLSNKLVGKIESEDGMERYKDLLFFKMGTCYNFSRPRKDYILEEDKYYHPKTRFIGEFRFNPCSEINFESNWNYHIYQGEFHRLYNTILELNNKRKDSISFEYRQVKEILEQISTTAHFKINSSISFGIENRYQLSEDHSLETDAHVLYQASCWGLDFVFNKKPEEEGRKKESKFYILFSLSGLGKARLY
jgi:LPS-assembly protein